MGDKDSFLVSVVIAVYNGQDFIDKALESCHHFDCVKEVIIIDDGSTDNSLKTALKCKKKYNKLLVSHHENFQNKGAGASWNLGINMAKYEWIAILGVDDVFLPNRFDRELELYNSNIDFDGVYGALGLHFYTKSAERKFKEQFGENHRLTTVTEVINPEELKYVLLGIHPNKYGYFSLDALTVKKQLLLDVGLFNPKLRLHQDTDIIIKLSIKGKLFSGVIEKPISLRGVHENNRITNNKNLNQSRYIQYNELYKWSKNQALNNEIKYQIFNQSKYYEYLFKDKPTNIFSILKFTLTKPTIFYNNDFFVMFMNINNSNSIFKIMIIKIVNKTVQLFFNNQQEKYRTTYKHLNE